MAFHNKNSIYLIIIICLLILSTGCSASSTPQHTADPIKSPPPTPLALPSGSGGGIIVFASDRNRGHMDLYLINADGSELTQITHTNDDIIAPSWSPDGSYLAFLISKFNQLNIAILPLESVLADVSADHSIVLVEDPVESSPPAWSPDGSMLFYAAAPGENIDLYKIDLDGKNKVQITDTDFHEKHPALAPDGTKLVYSSDRSGSFDIYLIDDFDLRNPQIQSPIQITFGEGDELFPAWSPDGSRIVFTTTEKGSKDISYIDLESRTVHSIQDSSADEWKAAWSPDSTQLVFSYFNFDNSLNDIYIYSIESEASVPITEDQFDNWWPDWKP